MSLDERIRQLSDSVLDDLRSPIEATLRRLLGDLLQAANEEREGERHAQEQALASLRESLTAEHQQALAVLRESLTAEHEAAIAALRDQEAVEREAAVQAICDELARNQQDTIVSLRQALAAEHEAAIATALEEAGRHHAGALSALEEQLTAERASGSEADLLRDQLTAQHEAEMTALRDSLAQEHAQVVARLQDEHAVAKEEAVLRARLAADANAASAAALQEELDRVHAEVELLNGQKAELEGELSLARQANEALLAAAPLAQEPADGPLEVAEAHSSERQAELACTELMLDTLRRMDQETTLGGVLTALVDGAAPEAGRALLLTYTGGRLRGYRAAGFGESDIPSMVLSPEADPLFAKALITGQPTPTSDPELGTRANQLPPSLALPEGRLALAVPIIVGTRPVALLYVDDAGMGEPRVPSTWPEVAEVLVRHASRCLELLTVTGAAARMRAAVEVPATPGVAAAVRAEARQEAGPAPAEPTPLEERIREEESARRYARLLLSEVKLYNEDVVNEGRRERDLLARLGPEIERARRLYEEKIPLPVRERVDCFDEELVRTLADGDRTLLGQIT